LCHQNSPISIDEEDEADKDDDSEPEEVTPTTVHGSKKRKRGK